ncbi:hypothetical protein [Segatella bryantii]|jgi:hypothetical protein|uniref:hypothetical protein n=1 Tax=Segatella bryantii TaxID=77095 RepID=UPI000942D4F7|nr:hypothetical protein [Segatella bryantii]
MDQRLKLTEKQQALLEKVRKDYKALLESGVSTIINLEEDDFQFYPVISFVDDGAHRPMIQFYDEEESE